MKTVDYSNLVLGRAASKTAKLLLNGESITIVHAEKAVVRGTRSGILEKFQRRENLRSKGNPEKKGAKISRMPDKIVRFSIKHMIPYGHGKGQQALKRLRIHMGLPKQMEGVALEQWKELENQEKKNFLTVQQISEAIGLRKVKA